MIRIPSSPLSPEIVIDPENSFIGLKGMCIPKVASQLFDPVLDAAEYMLRSNRTIKLSLELSYFNSASSHYLMRIFNRLAAGKTDTVNVQWRFEEEDDENREKGQFFAELSGLKFDFVELAHTV